VTETGKLVDERKLAVGPENRRVNFALHKRTVTPKRL